MKREFVKNFSLRLASRFFGTFAADSLIVNNEWSLLTFDLCTCFSINLSHTKQIYKYKEKQGKDDWTYKLRIIGPVYLFEKTTFLPCFWYQIPRFYVFPKSRRKEVRRDKSIKSFLQIIKLASLTYPISTCRISRRTTSYRSWTALTAPFSKSDVCTSFCTYMNSKWNVHWVEHFL